MDQYLVERHGDSWKVKYEGSYIGIFPAEALATRWAVDLAHNAKARFVEARVLVQDENRVFRIAWTNRSNGWHGRSSAA